VHTAISQNQRQIAAQCKAMVGIVTVVVSY